MPITSLNQGFELDTIQQNPGHELDKALFENIVPGQIPELKSDAAADGLVGKSVPLNTVKEAVHGTNAGSGNVATTLEEMSKDIDQLVGKYDDLEYLHQDISATRGMNQRLALECEELLPGFLNESRPLGFFTATTTQTQYKLSLEYVVDTKKTVMQAILASLQALLEKMTEWYKDYQKQRSEEQATLDVRRMYVIHEQGTEVGAVIDDMYKLIRTTDYDSQLHGKLGVAKEGSEDWYTNFMEHHRTGTFSVKEWIGRTGSVKILFAAFDDFSLLAGHVQQATNIQNQLVTMINANAEAGMVNLLDGTEFKRIESYIAEFQQAEMTSAEFELPSDFRPGSIVQPVMNLFKSISFLESSRDDRLATMQRVTQAVARANADFAATQHNSDSLSKLKNAQITLSKLSLYEVKLIRGMHVLVKFIVNEVHGYKDLLDDLLAKAAKASDNTARVADVLDYQLVKRILNKFLSLEGKSSG